ncbi:hypothetical protein ZHAS_00007274 [Anopheles sinensis]|uniref:Uncharacterized protein n=1 Tax=Anopheles sinensis TaxID=74873 RepID=A0A084VPK2_ANOSI|nr:hypothetical protein ZHAS_00007274 [Anopheles sinensis]
MQTDSVRGWKSKKNDHSQSEPLATNHLTTVAQIIAIGRDRGNDGADWVSRPTARVQEMGRRREGGGEKEQKINKRPQALRAEIFNIEAAHIHLHILVKLTIPTTSPNGGLLRIWGFVRDRGGAEDRDGCESSEDRWSRAPTHVRVSGLSYV